jgi:hypothetical protein
MPLLEPCDSAMVVIVLDKLNSQTPIVILHADVEQAVLKNHAAFLANPKIIHYLVEAGAKPHHLVAEAFENISFFLAAPDLIESPPCQPDVVAGDEALQAGFVFAIAGVVLVIDVPVIIVDVEHPFVGAIRVNISASHRSTLRVSEERDDIFEAGRCRFEHIDRILSNLIPLGPLQALRDVLKGFLFLLVKLINLALQLIQSISDFADALAPCVIHI